MKYLTLNAVMALLLSIGGIGMTVQPAFAQGDTDPEDAECVQSCDDDFPGSWPIQVAMRGYCYIIRCSLS